MIVYMFLKNSNLCILGMAEDKMDDDGMVGRDEPLPLRVESQDLVNFTGRFGS